MAGTGTFFQTVYLSDYGAQNPFTVASSGLVSVTSGDAIAGTAGYASPLFDQETIAPSAGYGVDLATGGLVVNGQSGSSADLISGYRFGVEIAQTSGTVVNSGTIAGDLGVDLSGGGTPVSNSTIATTRFAVASGGMVTNAGMITSGTGDGGAGTSVSYATIGTSGLGVSLSSGGVLPNSGTITGATGTSARIIGGYFYGIVNLGVSYYNGSATVTSTGTVVGPSTSRGPYGGGGYNTIIDGGVAGTLANFGTIVSPRAAGVYLTSGGFVTNTASGGAGGYITGSTTGIYIGGGAGAITNTGRIKGGSGVVIGSGSTATVTNSGTIMGTLGTAVSLGGGSNRLIVTPGAVFDGKVDGGGGASVLEIAAPPAPGASLSGANGAQGVLGDTTIANVSLGGVANFSALQIDNSATVDSSGTLSFDTLVNQGQVNVASGDALAFGTVASAASTGVINLRTGGLIHFEGAVGNQTLIFNPAGGTAVIDHPEQFAGSITHFEAVDTIDLDLGKATDPVYSGGTLNLFYGSATIALSVATQYDHPKFLLADDTNVGTDVTVEQGPPPVTEALVSDTGASASDGVTSDPAVGGSGDPGLVVTLTEGISTIGTTTADGTGAWSFTPSGLADGAHTLAASETDAAGATGTASLGFTLKTSAPAPSGLQSLSEAHVTTPLIIGQGEAGDGVTLFDGAVQVGVATVGTDGSWSIITSPLTYAVHQMAATEIDVAGNTSVSSALLELTVLAPGNFTGTITDGIVLSSVTQNPATLAVGGYVTNNTTLHRGDAVYGTNTAAWDFTNSGTLQATGTASDGIEFTAGGTVINTASALIAGVANGVGIGGGAGMIDNLGTIASDTAIGLSGGVIVNGESGSTAGLISGGYFAIQIGGAGAVVNFATIAGTSGHVGAIRLDGPATVANYGTISGGPASAVYMDAGGSVTNGRSGSGGGVIAGSIGVNIGGGAGTVTNFGTIVGNAASYTDGVLLDSGAVTNFGTILAVGTGGSVGVGIGGGGILVNGASGSPAGLILGYYAGVLIGGSAGTVVNFGTIASVATGRAGVFLDAGGTVANYGTIAGGPGGPAIYTRAGASVSNAPGAVIAGIEVNPGGAGTVVNLGTIAGGAGLAAGGLVVNGQSGSTAGLITGGFFAVQIGGSVGTVANFGTILATGTGNSVGVALNGAGTLLNAGTIRGAGATAVTLGGTAGDLVIVEPGAVFGGAIAGFGQGDTIDLAGVAASGVLFAAGTLNVFSGGTMANSFVLPGDFQTQRFVTAPDGNGGTDITVAAPPAGTFRYTYTSGILLSNPSAQNPATVTSGAYVTNDSGFSNGDAVYGNNAAFWTLSNYGTIRATAAYARAIDLAAGGVVANRAGGVIASNANGIDIGGGAGTVTNLGTIVSSEAAIYLPGGGNVVNGQSGSSAGLIAGSRAVLIENGVGSVANFGTIAGNAASYSDGVDLFAGGLVTNYGTILGTAAGSSFGVGSGGGFVVNGASGATSALILGAYAGVSLGGTAAGMVVNFGTIASVYPGRDGIELHAGGTVSNGGTIASGPGGHGIYTQAGASITNAQGAVIVSSGNAVQIGGGAGTVINLGTIAGTGTGSTAIGLSGGGIVVNGQSGSAAGLIAGGYFAIQIGGGAGTVVNFATITGTSGHVGAIRLDGGGIVANYGTISGGPASGVFVAGGVVTNGRSGSGGGLIAGSTGVLIGGAGAVTNYGTIAGTVASYSDGVLLEAGGSVANFGTILGTSVGGSTGVGIGSGGTLVNGASGTAAGLILGYYAGVLIGGSAGTVVNFGTIASVATGRAGVFLDAGGTVSNYGTIAGGPSGVGMYLRRGGNVTNKQGGVIVGAGSGVAIARAAGTVTNDGTIIATGSYASAVDIRYGVFINHGLVEGAASGIVLGGTITTFGTIVSPGTTTSASGTVTVSGTVIGATGISTALSNTAGYTVSVGGSVIGNAGTAVALGGRDRLILTPGAQFQGNVDGGGGTSVLEIAAPPASGASLSGAGGVQNIVADVTIGSVANFSALQVDNSATVDSSGTLSFDTLVNQGQVNVGSGDSLAFGNVASAASTGVINLRTGGLVHFAGGVGNQTLIFNPAGGTAVLDRPDQFFGSITHFEAVDIIDLGPGAVTGLQYSGGVLSFSYGGIPVGLNVATQYASPIFNLADDNNGGTDITVEPGLPPVTEGLVFDTGSSASDGVTSNPAVGGSGDPGLVVTISEAGTTLGTTTANGAGAWIFTPSGLADGAHNLVASETDADGNTGTASLSFTLKTSAPAPSEPVLSAASDNGVTGDDVTSVVTPAITGTGEVGDMLTLFDGSTVVGTGTVASDGTWSVTTSALALGSHALSATEIDIAANASGFSAALTLTIVDFGALATQLYLDILDRDPNADELTFWTGQLAGGVSLADARTTLANTPEAQNDLALLYQDELDRAPDPGGIAYFTNFLATGGKLHDLRTDFANSAEAQNDLALLYEDELDRAPDPGGIAYFTNFLINGGKLHDLRTDIANSQEAQDDLALLYQDELDRAPDPGGIAYFTNFLIIGGKLHDLRTDFANSAEAQNDLGLLYQDELDRAPDPGGIAYFTNFLIIGGKLHDLRTDFANSQEAQDDLTALYQNELGRAPDPGGIAYFTNFLIDGGKLHDLRTDIANSVEAQTDLTAIYQNELGRTPGSDELAFVTNTLISGTSLDDLRTIFAHSAEAQGKLATIFQGVEGRLPDQAELAGMENQLSPPVLASLSDVQTALTASPNTPLGFTVVAGGTTADLVLTAPPGPAEFDFGGWVFGQDEIAGFDPTQDAIRLSTSLAGDFATLQAEMSTTAGGGTLITLNPSQSLTLDAVAPTSLAAANFRFT